MNYRNAKYIDDRRIDCEIEHPIHGWIPYTLDPADTDMTIDNNALLAAMASAGDVSPYVAPLPPTQAELDKAQAQSIRATRDMKLSTEVDPIAGNALRWAELDAETQSLWSDYRKALLDVPQQDDFPYNITWPNPPV